MGAFERRQFRKDVKVNPLDVEEIVWDIASQSRLNPADIPPKNMLSLPKGKTDSRRIMVSCPQRYFEDHSAMCYVSPRVCVDLDSPIRLFRKATVLSLFQGNATEADLAAAGHNGR